MRPGRSEGTEFNRAQKRTDILELARKFEIDPDRLGDALEEAAGLMQMSRENIRPANRKTLGRTGDSLDKALGRLLEPAIRERLLEAAVPAPDGSQDQNEADRDLARYEAWWSARQRVDRALAGAQDLLALVRAAEAFEGSAGRPSYGHWEVGAGSLMDFWIYELKRDVTVSAHGSDPRGASPSPTLAFVHQSLRLLGEEISEQACRTVLQNVKLRKDREEPIGSRSYP